MKRLLLFPVSGLAAFVLLQCGLFEPRDPEDPSASGFGFLPQTTPDNVIANLQTAIAKKSLRYYMDCFNDPATSGLGFVFTPSVNLRNELADWTYADEESYFRNLSGETQADELSNLALSDVVRQSNGSDSAEVTAHYLLEFRHSRPTTPRVVRGSLQFFLFNNQSTWRIHRWIDNRTDTDSTWSRLKKDF